MRTWQTIAFALAVGTTLQAYADDHSKTMSHPTTSSGASMGSPDAASRTPGDAATTSTDARAMGSTTASTEMKNISTDKFFNTAAAAGMKEVQAAELALRNAKSDEVKTFAREMISDHTKQNSQLTTLAAQNNVKVPKELPAKDKADIEKLRTAKGATFDTAFAQQMQADHAKAVALFQGCADSSKVEKSVQSFCRNNVSTLQQHAHAANNLDTGTGTRAANAADE